MTFLEEMELLQSMYEEEENTQKAYLKADQISWDGHSYTLGKLYADIKFAWLVLSPEVDLKNVKAREMLRIITEKNYKLGIYLQQQIDRRFIQPDDHVILKEAEAWLDWEALVQSGSGLRKPGYSENLLRKRVSREIEMYPDIIKDVADVLEVKNRRELLV